MSISVDASGKVIQVQANGGSERLQRAAQDAAVDWEFSPIARTLRVDFAFVLRDKKTDVCKPSVHFGAPIRVKVCEQRKQIVTISDPPMVDLSKPEK